MKFSAITHLKIEEAIARHDAMSEEELSRYGKPSRTYFLHYNNSVYPPKRIIRLALNKTTKELQDENFNFIAIEAKNYLIKLGFEVDGDRKPRVNVSASKNHSSQYSLPQYKDSDPTNKCENDDKILYEGLLKERKRLAGGRSVTAVRRLKYQKDYTCEVCNFTFHKRIVEGHHLTPFAKIKGKREVCEDDFVLLCPNCHAIAHYLLNIDSKYEQKELLIEELKKIMHSM